MSFQLYHSFAFCSLLPDGDFTGLANLTGILAINTLSHEALAKVIFVILSEAKDLDSSVACGSLRMTDM